MYGLVWSQYNQLPKIVKAYENVIAAEINFSQKMAKEGKFLVLQDVRTVKDLNFWIRLARR